MAQAADTNTTDLQKRVEELEMVMRTVLEQINSHQVYEKDARGLIRRTLGTNKNASAPQPRQAGEFPSLFPSATSNFI